MTDTNQLDALWEEYDRALIAFTHSASYSGDPDQVRSDREWWNEAKGPLRDAGQQPILEEDQAVAKYGWAHYNKPYLREQLRQMRACRRAAP
ncbi:hypothetical protein [Amycolatopsis sp. GM8]|uniref:hypothetical protein n=1 Tax=Amycolatopsis sp. GM8 TaxID=2896530 RepID=UPI001F4191B5|nr:hypothetical protein [Amycolatopsis sp. GM8]